MFWSIRNFIFIILSKIWTICFVTILCFIDYIYKRTIYKMNNKVIGYYYMFVLEYISVIIGSFTVFFLFALRPGYEANMSIAAPLARFAAKLLGTPVTIRNRENLAIDSAAICTINHQSAFDLIVTLNFWDIPKKLIVLGKSELKYVPPYGPMALLAGLQFVTRNNNELARAQMTKIGQVIRERKVKMLVYPEGTRNTNRAEFLPFKKGAFHTAVSAQIPIIPMVISPYYFLDSEKKTFGDGRVIIQILEPVPTEGLTAADVPALAQKVRDMMFKTYQELSKEVLGEAAQESVDLGLTQKLL